MYCPKIKNVLNSFQPGSMKIIYTYQCSGAWNKIKTVAFRSRSILLLIFLIYQSSRRMFKKRVTSRKILNYLGYFKRLKTKMQYFVQSRNGFRTSCSLLLTCESIPRCLGMNIPKYMGFCPIILINLSQKYLPCDSCF